MSGKPERLQKIIAQAGIASRRASELLIQNGRVTVNGHVVTQLGIKVNPNDVIAVDGESLAKADPIVYIALHKPIDVLSTSHDERGRLTVLDLVDIPERVYPVGRLDVQSEGLLLLTNDGDLAEKLTHPRYHIDKEYHVLVSGKPSSDTIRKWRDGKVELEEFKPRPAIVRYLNGEEDGTWLTVILQEGHKRQIRLIAEKLGHPVKKLIRIRIGPITLGKLKLGHWRKLNPTEVQQLRKLVSEKAANAAAKPKPFKAIDKAKSSQNESKWAKARPKPKGSNRPIAGKAGRAATPRSRPKSRG